MPYDEYCMMNDLCQMQITPAHIINFLKKNKLNQTCIKHVESSNIQRFRWSKTRSYQSLFEKQLFVQANKMTNIKVQQNVWGKKAFIGPRYTQWWIFWPSFNGFNFYCTNLFRSYWQPSLIKNDLESMLCFSLVMEVNL